MKKYQINIQTVAKATVIVEAPDEALAIEYLRDNLDGFGVDWEVDEMMAEVDAGFRDVRRGSVTVVDEPWGIEEINKNASADYTVDEDWLRDAGYEIVITVRKRETVEE